MITIRLSIRGLESKAVVSLFASKNCTIAKPEGDDYSKRCFCLPLNEQIG